MKALSKLHDPAAILAATARSAIVGHVRTWARVSGRPCVAVLGEGDRQFVESPRAMAANLRDTERRPRQEAEAAPATSVAEQASRSTRLRRLARDGGNLR